MQALQFSEAEGLRLVRVPLPAPAPHEALVRVLRAGVCSTDLEILKGYVPAYSATLGHEFVGVVERCASNPALEGRRVVGEINCRCPEVGFTHDDPVMVRNHASGRTVLGIIGRDGTMAQSCALPAENLFPVPEELSDQEACFAEPLAAACRIVEQQVLLPGGRVAVIGDGKLGLLAAQLLVLAGHDVTLLGRHARKMALVEGGTAHVVSDTTATDLAQAFDVAVEASGSSQGIKLALALTRPLATVVLKSTCSAVGDAAMPDWSSIANEVVVHEKTLLGSRCGPFAPALLALQDARMRRLVNAMVDGVFPLAQGPAAIEKARQRGTLKVQLTMPEPLTD